jgi:hypothetical protein
MTQQQREAMTQETSTSQPAGGPDAPALNQTAPGQVALAGDDA